VTCTARSRQLTGVGDVQPGDPVEGPQKYKSLCSEMLGHGNSAVAGLRPVAAGLPAGKLSARPFVE
jgi:hypothetical protein